MTHLQGRCLCGAVTWTATGPVTRNLVCHCDSCRRATSAPLTAFLGLDPARVTWRGMINDFESSPGTFRGFCPACGTRLYFRSDRWPQEVHIHAMTLDDPSDYMPDAQVFCTERLAWLDAIDRVPSYDGFHRVPAQRP